MDLGHDSLVPQSVLAGEGFEVIYEATTGPLTPNRVGHCGGCIAEPQSADGRTNWCAHHRTLDLREQPI